MTRLDLAAIRAWTRAQEASRRAYHEDRAVAEGLCAECRANRRKPCGRKCSTCVKGADKEAARQRKRRARVKEGKA